MLHDCRNGVTDFGIPVLPLNISNIFIFFTQIYMLYVIVTVILIITTTMCVFDVDVYLNVMVFEC